MANVERPEEVAARLLVERLTGLSFEHADKNGGVDYKTTDGIAAALEVTTVTSAKAKKNSIAAGEEMSTPALSTTLQQCWMIVLDEAHPRFTGILQRTEPHLLALEAAGLASLQDHDAAIHALERDHLAEPSRGLLTLHVRQAWAIPELCMRAPAPHTHRIHLLTIGGRSSQGSDAALALVEEELNSRKDNYAKLAAASVHRTHLFAWLDGHTPHDIARPLSPGGVLDELPHFALPTRPPRLAEPVDELWVVHRGTGHGWRWNGTSWSAIDNTGL